MQWIGLLLVFLVAAFACLLAYRLKSRLTVVKRELETLQQQAEQREKQLGERFHHLGRLLLRSSHGKPISQAVALDSLPFEQIDGETAWKLLETSRSVMLVDVRDPHEYRAGHIPGALWIPLSQLEERWEEVSRDADYVIIHCAAGSRSAAACEYLSREHGYLNLYNLAGGLSDWPGPVETGRG